MRLNRETTTLNMSRLEIIDELHKRALKNFPRKSVKILGLNDLWQTDLMILDSLSKINSGYKYILVVIDCFSKFVWVRKLKTKTGKEVADQMHDIFIKSKQTPSNIQSDMGTEFYSSHFRSLLKELNINHYSTYTHIKANFAERVIRTLKEKLWKHFTIQGNNKWIKIIDKIVDEYNNTKHSTIKIEPKNVSKKNEKFILKAYFNQKTSILKSPKYSIGDFVRISKYKKIFEKGYTPNYTTEIFKIVQVNKKYPTTYLLEDYQGQPILGQFYEPELLKVKHPQSYLVEKVIKRKGAKSFVKWLGFDSSHNTWVNNTDII